MTARLQIHSMMPLSSFFSNEISTRILAPSSLTKIPSLTSRLVGPHPHVSPSRASQTSPFSPIILNPRQPATDTTSGGPGTRTVASTTTNIICGSSFQPVNPLGFFFFNASLAFSDPTTCKMAHWLFATAPPTRVRQIFRSENLERPFTSLSME